MDLDVLRPVAERAARYRGQKLGEQNTKRTLIEPVLRALGWDLEDLEEVRSEYKYRPRDKPVDYALLLLRSPVLFVEAKGLGENLSDRRWASQIVSYASVAGVTWVALTDGDEYRIYNAHAPVDVDEKLFRTVRLSEDLEQAARTLALLSKEQLHGHVLESLWKAESAERKVKRALHDLFSPEPDRWLVRRLAKAIEGLSESEIRGALARAQLELAFPPLLVGTASPQVEPARSTSEKRQKAPRTALKKSRPETSVSLHDLLGTRLIRPPLNLSKTYLGRELSACIEADGRVTCLGQTYESLSTAAGIARASVRAAPPGRKYPQTNGWTFWQFRDEDGQLRELGVLRERYLAQQVRQLDTFREQRERPTARG